MYHIDDLRRDAASRRAFLARMGAAGLGTAALALIEGCSGSSNKNTGNGRTTRVPDPANFPGVTGNNENQAVLNYALTLERLEADLYRQALNVAAGRALTAPLDSTPPAANTAGNYTLKVPAGSIAAQFVTPAFLYLVQYAYVEAAHRDFLTTALGAAAAPVTSASGNYKFATANGQPGTDLATILSNILPLEESGVRAYLGAAGFLTDNVTVQTAATIYSTECRHSAAIEYILGMDPGPNNNISGVPAGEFEVQTASAPNIFEKALKPATVLTAASNAYFA